jgi:GT2 family glycosyltransferase
MTGSDAPAQRRLAVLVTCHNRVASTEAMLRSFLAQDALADRRIDCRVFLVDDGSTDGTGAMAAALDERIEVLTGDGTLFWCRGMAVAHAAARRWAPDLYLWLNDDIVLDPGALGALLDARATLLDRGEGDPVVAGTIVNREDGSRFGGGGILSVKLWRYGIARVEDVGGLERVNCVAGCLLLTSASLLDSIEPFTDTYRHGRADMEFGLQAERRGATVWVAPGFLATGVNPSGAHHDEGLSPIARLRILRRSPLTRYRIADLARFSYRVGGWRWPIWTATIILRRSRGLDV